MKPFSLAPTVVSSKGLQWLREALLSNAHKNADAQAQINHLLEAAIARYGLR